MGCDLYKKTSQGINIMPMEHNDFDLNLMRIFATIYRLRSVSKSAIALDVAQPTVSKALRRMRDLLGDRLFVSAGGTLVPTDVALRIAPLIESGLLSFDDALSIPRGFDPLRSMRPFDIAMSDIAEAVILPPLLEHCRENAPGVSFRVHPVPDVELSQALQVGDLDLGVGFAPDVARTVIQQKLFECQYVCISRRTDPIDIETFISSRHAVARANGSGHDLVVDMIERTAGDRAIGTSVPGFLPLAFVVAKSDLLATVPDVLARIMRGVAGLTIHPHPISLPAIVVRQFWHARSNDDDGHRWLRHTLMDIIRKTADLRPVF